MKKTFVLDTNVLLHNSNCVEAFADNTVVIPMAVIEELDKFKSNNDELGRNARQVIRKLDRLRKRGHSQKHDDIEDHSSHLTDNALPMERVLSAAQDADLIQRCLQRLSATHREVLHLAFFEDLPYQEIASIAQCPEGTVKTRVFHAKLALKNCLAKADPPFYISH